MIKIFLAFVMFIMMNNSFEYYQQSPPIQERTFEQKTILYDDTFERVVTSQVSDQTLKVNYELREQDIYVECIIKDFSFNKENAGSMKRKGEGHIQLFINNAKVDSIFTPSFIIKDLPQGTYKIKIELVHNDYTPYGINEEFEVTVP